MNPVYQVYASLQVIQGITQDMQIAALFLCVTLSMCGCQYSSCWVLAAVLLILEKKVGLVRYISVGSKPNVSAITAWIFPRTSLMVRNTTCQIKWSDVFTWGSMTEGGNLGKTQQIYDDWNLYQCKKWLCSISFQVGAHDCYNCHQ